MFKKLFIYGGLLTVVAVLLFGGAAFSHVKNGVSWVRGQVQEKVPVEYELQRARQLIQDSKPEIKKCKRLIAQKQVEIRYLRKSIGELELAHANSTRKLEFQGTALRKNQDTYDFGVRTVSRRMLERDASRELRRARAQQAMLASKSQQLVALENSLVFAVEKLENVKTERQKLEIKVQELEAKLQQTEAMKAATSNFSLDSSNLARANEILNRCQKRLDVTQQLIENDEPMVPTLMEDELDGTDISSEISAYLNGGAAAEKVEQIPAASSELVPVKHF